MERSTRSSILSNKFIKFLHHLKGKFPPIHNILAWSMTRIPFGQTISSFVPFMRNVCKPDALKRDTKEKNLISNSVQLPTNILKLLRGKQVHHHLGVRLIDNPVPLLQTTLLQNISNGLSLYEIVSIIPLILREKKLTSPQHF